MYEIEKLQTKCSFTETKLEGVVALQVVYPQLYLFLGSHASFVTCLFRCLCSFSEMLKSCSWLLPTLQHKNHLAESM